jgi:hypothetical protein
MSEQIASELPLPAGASMLAIGLMSGTSQDGVDVALIDSDGEQIGQLGATACRPYAKAERTLLRRATAAAANLTDRTTRPDVVAEAERLINEALPRQWNRSSWPTDCSAARWRSSVFTVKRCCTGRNGT